MKYKPVPTPPEDLEALERVVRAMPADSAAVEDCCGHLVSTTAIDRRDEAAEWLTFLRALGLVEKDVDGYFRVEDAIPADGVDVNRCRPAFCERVAGVEAMLETLERAEKPITEGEIADAVEDGFRSGRPRSRDRLERLLRWAVLFGLVECDGERYLRDHRN